MTVKGRPVSISPNSHIDDGGLLDLSMDEVVERFLEKEKRRYKEAKDDETQQEVAISVRRVPVGLTAVLEAASYRMGVSRSVLTRCLSHQIAAWYDSLASLHETITQFYDAYQKALDYGFPDLCKRLKLTPYEPASSSEEFTSFSSVSWVRGKLYGLSLPLGVPTYQLFVIGLCRSLSRGGLYTKTASALCGDVDRFLLYTGQRLIEVQNFIRLVDYRIAQAEPQARENVSQERSTT